MVKFDNDNFLKYLIETSQKTIEKDGNHVPMFFMVGRSGGIAAIAMPFDGYDQKEKGVEVIKKLVDESGCELYYSVFDAFMSSPQKEQKVLKKAIDKVQNAEDFMKILEMAEKMGKMPSQSPVKVECLVVSEYDKVQGTRTTIIPYHRLKDGVKFEKPKMEGYTSGFNRWNVWQQEQVVVEDGGKKVK